LGADLIWRRYAAALSFLCAWLTRVYSIALWYLSALHWRIPGNVAAAAAARIHDASDSIFTSSSHIRIHVISIGILLAAAAEAWAMMPWWLPAGTHCNASSPRWWAITITAALLLQLSEKHWPARACRPYTSQNWSSHVETPWRWHLSFRSEEHCEFKQLGASRLNCWPQLYLLLSIVPTDTGTWRTDRNTDAPRGQTIRYAGFCFSNSLTQYIKLDNADLIQSLILYDKGLCRMPRNWLLRNLLLGSPAQKTEGKTAKTMECQHHIMDRTEAE